MKNSAFAYCDDGFIFIEYGGRRVRIEPESKTAVDELAQCFYEFGIFDSITCSSTVDFPDEADIDPKIDVNNIISQAIRKARKIKPTLKIKWKKNSVEKSQTKSFIFDSKTEAKAFIDGMKEVSNRFGLGGEWDIVKNGLK